MNKFFKKILPAVALSVCVAGAVCVTSACASKDYSDEFSKLQQQIDDLKNENNSLKDIINNFDQSDYSQQIEDLQQQLEDLQNQNNSNSAEIDKNLAEIEKLQQQVAILEQVASNQLKTYKIGETFIFNYCDTYSFSISLPSIKELVIENIKSPYPIQINDLIQITTIAVIETQTFRGTIALDNKSLKPGTKHTQNLSGSLDEYNTTIYIGLPISDKSVIPYAIFDLTSST